MKTFFAAAAVVMMACGPMGSGVEIAVADHADALTASAKDNLFTMTLVTATKDYAIADVTLVAGLAGQTATVVNFTHNDANGDGKLNQGESLSATEPPVNLFDATTVGKPVSVSLDERSTGSTTLIKVSEATWTPAN